MCASNSKIHKTVQVGDQTCAVETLREWLNSRITQIRQSLRGNEDSFLVSYAEQANLAGRLAELMIIREKLNDGRICEIG